MSTNKALSSKGIFFKAFSYVAISPLTTYISIVFGITAFLLLTGIITDFRVMLLTFVLVWFLLWLRIKNLVLSSYLMAIFSFAFFAPNKYYTQEIIRGADMLLPIYKGGYYLGYGLNLSNMFVLLSIVFLGTEYVRTTQAWLLFRGKPFRILGFCAAGFILMGLNASFRYSPFIALSLTWLLQYLQLFAVAILTVYLFLSARKNFHLLFIVVVISSMFQCIVAGLQFLRQAPIRIPVEQATGTNYFATGIDEINAIYRVAGTYAFHNQLALIMLVFAVLLIPMILMRRQLIGVMLLFTIFIIIILTQSRSVWMASLIVGFTAIKLLHADIRRFLLSVNWKKLAIYLFVGFTTMSYIIIPRVLLTANTFYQGAGGAIRIRLFKEALSAFLLNPWLGYGVGTNEYVFHALNTNSVMLVFPTAVHLAVLQLALEVGLIGLIFLLFPFVYIVRSLMSNWGTTREFRAYAFRFIGGSLAFFTYYLFLPHVGIIEFAYLGIILGCGGIATLLAQETHESK